VILDYLEVDTKVLDIGMEIEDNKDTNDVLAII